MTATTTRMFALGLSYFLTDGMFPVDFILNATDTYGIDKGHQIMADIEDAAKAIEDMGVDSVQDYLSSYHLSLETGIQLVSIEYDAAEGTSSITYTA